MKSMKKAFVYALCLITVFSCAACKKDDDPTQNGGTGEPTIKYTDEKLVDGGKTDYKLLVSEAPTEEELLAVAEFNNFFAEATGGLMEIRYETGEATPEGKYISIGETKAYNASAVKFDYKSLNASGYGVKTSGDDVYIVGNNSGVIYGVYEMLEQQFNYGYFDDGVYEIDKAVTEEYLIDFNVEYEPAIEYRVETSKFQSYASDDMYLYRMKLNASKEFHRVGIANGSWHNFFTAIPPSVYNDVNKPETYHPEWFGTGMEGKTDDKAIGQLCLTRDKAGLAAEMVKIIEGQLQVAEANSETIDYIHIGMQDFSPWCACSACDEVIKKYGGYDVSTYVLFMNEVADQLTAKGLDVGVSMFAYHDTEDAPLKKNAETGEYELVSQDLVLRDNVSVVYAPINADYYEPFNNMDKNANAYTNLQGWAKISKQLFVWSYVETFQAYAVPFDNFNSMQTNVKLMAENNVVWHYPQGQHNNENQTGFSHIKAYLHAKLMWNPDYDIEALTEAYCNAVYKDAAPMMLRILDEYKTWRAYTFYELGVDGNIHTQPNETHWNATLLNGWLDIYDEAYAAIEKYKATDKVLYDRIYNAINLETLSYRYLLIQYFPESFTKSELREAKLAWRLDANTLRFTMYKETEPILTLYKEWGIAD
ncbi:MAG: DUF4838 domain-containing protein [Clostridia bacterium]|nr:DUF4838 domain-containing protein [Clostridia bacterium]